jgi:hypothetical protein
MEQKFEGTPRAEIRLNGRRVTRTALSNDWGLLLRWEVRHNGKVVATPNARLEEAYEHPSAAPGTYEIVLQMWQYVNYKKKSDGEFTESKFVDVSKKVTYKV